MLVLDNRGILSMRTFAVSLLSVTVLASVVGISAAQAAGQVASLRRLTQEEYRNSVADIFGKEIEVHGMFEPHDPDSGLEATSTVDPVRDPGRF